MVSSISGRSSLAGIEQLTLGCSRLGVSGTGPFTVTTATSTSTVPNGSVLSGTAIGPLACSPGANAIGISTRTSTAVNLLTLRCTSPRVYRVRIGSGVLTTPIGSATGGTAFAENCPSGGFLTGFQASTPTASSGPLSQFIPACNRVVSLAGTGPWQFVTSSLASRLTTRGTSVAAVTGTSICPAGQVAIGVAGRASTTLTQFAIACAPVTIE